MTWIPELFGAGKPIIGMAHFKPLPGDPRYDPAVTFQEAADSLLKDVVALQAGGVDGIMFSNEGSQPWMLNPPSVTAVSMAALVGRVRSAVRIPFGVHVIWDPRKTIELAAAVGADFAWETFTGVYASDFGLWNTNAGAVIRRQRQLDALQVRLFFEVVPEAGVYLGNRPAADHARSTIFNTRPDALCVAGLKPGEEASLDGISQIKKVSGAVPVFASTGVKPANVEQQLSIADGAIVGSAFKKDGNLWKAVDEKRVRALMEIVKKVRISD